MLLVTGGFAGLALIGLMLAADSLRLLGLAVPVLVMLGFAMLVNPAVFLTFFVGLRPLVDVAVFFPVGGYTLGTIWGAALLGVLFVYWLLHGSKMPMRDARWLVPAVFVIAYALFTMVGRTGDSFAATSALMKIASWVFLALACEQIAMTADGQRTIVRAGTLMATLTAAAIALAISQNQYGAAYYAGGEAYNTMGQGPHGLASMAVVSSAFVWMGAMHSRHRAVYAILAMLLGVGIALSLVRTTFLAYALVTGWFVLWSLRSRQPKVVLTALAAVVAVAIAVFMFQDAMLARLTDLTFLSGHGGVEMEAGSGRIGIWTTLISSATASASRLLLGQGAAGSLQAFAAVSGSELWAHNDFLEFLVTGGVGLLLLHLLTVAWLIEPGPRLLRDPRSTQKVRDVGALVFVIGFAYVVMAIFNGMAFYLSASLAMAMLVGLARGMTASPGETFLDTAGMVDVTDQVDNAI